MHSIGIHAFSLLDLDCFYAQVAMLCEPWLCEVPLAVTQKMLCVTSNYAARSRGVGKMSRIQDALKCVPNLMLRSGEDLFWFRKASSACANILSECLGKSGSIERVGLDEYMV